MSDTEDASDFGMTSVWTMCTGAEVGFANDSVPVNWLPELPRRIQVRWSSRPSGVVTGSNASRAGLVGIGAAERDAVSSPPPLERAMTAAVPMVTTATTEAATTHASPT